MVAIVKLAQPTPELPVPDVRAAQKYYRDRLGFRIEWYHEEGRIGAVSHGDCAIFFREYAGDARPAVFWIYAEDVDAAHARFAQLGADIVEAPQDKPWGLRQFTLRDVYGNTFYVFNDG